MAGERILVVDDEREIADLIRLYLIGEGYEVLLANTGNQAIEIIEYHNGRIWAESTVKKGSTFYFTLPLKN